MNKIKTLLNFKYFYIIAIHERNDSSSSNSSTQSSTLFQSPENSPKPNLKLSTSLRPISVHNTPVSSTTKALDHITLNSSDDETLADDLDRTTQKNKSISHVENFRKCNRYRPEIDNIYCNYPFQMHSSILYNNTQRQPKYVFENGVMLNYVNFYT
jgi:hypothetical protein